MSYYVYIVRCVDGSFYTGYSRNLGKRVRQHLRGKGARYLRIHRPEELVHVEEFRTRAEAMKRERRVKSLSHDQKLRLVRSDALAKCGAKRVLRQRTKAGSGFVPLVVPGRMGDC
jgi:putative endonuclease